MVRIRKQFLFYGNCCPTLRAAPQESSKQSAAAARPMNFWQTRSLVVFLRLNKSDSSNDACKFLDLSSGRYPRVWFGSGKQLLLLLQLLYDPSRCSAVSLYQSAAAARPMNLLTNTKPGCLLETYKGNSSNDACKLLDLGFGRYPREWFGSGNSFCSMAIAARPFALLRRRARNKVQPLPDQ